MEIDHIGGEQILENPIQEAELEIKIMSYDELSRHLNYDEIYCDNADTPHKCLLLYSTPLENKKKVPGITCNGPCEKILKAEDGFFHCKTCDWDLCLDCLSVYHP